MIHNVHPADKLGLYMTTAPADPAAPLPPGCSITQLIEQPGDRLRRKHFSLRTECTYAQWVKRYIYFPGKRHLTTARAGQMATPDPQSSVRELMLRRRSGVVRASRMPVDNAGEIFRGGTCACPSCEPGAF